MKDFVRRVRLRDHIGLAFIDDTALELGDVTALVSGRGRRAREIFATALSCATRFATVH